MSVAESLGVIKDQLVKSRTEIVSKIADLEAAVAASGEPSAEVTSALDELRGIAQSLDDVVADAVVAADVVVEDEASEPVEDA